MATLELTLTNPSRLADVERWTAHARALGFTGDSFVVTEVPDRTSQEATAIPGPASQRATSITVRSTLTALALPDPEPEAPAADGDSPEGGDS